MKKSYHVTPHEDGQWQVIRSGNERATRVFNTKEEALKFAREISSDKEANVISHNDKGKIEKVEKVSEEKDVTVIENKNIKKVEPVGDKHPKESIFEKDIEKLEPKPKNNIEKLEPQIRKDIEKTEEEEIKKQSSTMFVDPMVTEHNLNTPVTDESVIKESVDNAFKAPKQREGFFKRLFRAIFK